MDPFAAPSRSLHLGPENIIIKQRRKRLPLPAPCLNYPYAPTSPDVVPPDEDRFHLLDIPPAGNCTKEFFSHRDPLTYDGRTGEPESTPLISPICSHSESDAAPQSPEVIFDHDSEEMFVTVHGFLQDPVSRIGRKYGQRNRPTTAKPDAQVESGNGQRGRRVSAYSRIQSRHRDRAPRPRRKKQFAKSLAQRLFEADIFSSGTSSRPTSAPNPAHTSARRPLQFVTSLNLTPSLESRMYNRRKGHQRGRDGSRLALARTESEILAASNSAQDALPNRPAAAALTSSGGRWTRNKTTTQRAQIAGSAAGVMASSTSGRRTTACRARGGKQNTARVTPNPFGYVPLPLVRVTTRKGAV